MRIAPVIAAAAALALPASAEAAVACGVEGRGADGAAGDALAITTTELADGVALSREGHRIAVSDDRRMLPVDCVAGPATVGSIDSIELATGQEETFLYLDLAGGRLGPGATREPGRTSEIEVSIDWPFGFLGIGGSRRDDAYAFGSLGRDTFGYLTSDPDPELTAPNVGNVLVRGQGGGDVIVGFGPLEDDGSEVGELRIPANIDGGRGDDLIGGGRKADVIAGGPGDDLVFADRGRDEVDCGPGRDQVIAGRAVRVRRCELVERIR